MRASARYRQGSRLVKDLGKFSNLRGLSVFRDLRKAAYAEVAEPLGPNKLDVELLRILQAKNCQL